MTPEQRRQSIGWQISLAWRVGLIVVAVTVVAIALMAATGLRSWHSHPSTFGTETSRGVVVVMPGLTVHLQPGILASRLPAQMATVLIKVLMSILVEIRAAAPLGIYIIAAGIVACTAAGLWAFCRAITRLCCDRR